MSAPNTPARVLVAEKICTAVLTPTVSLVVRPGRYKVVAVDREGADVETICKRIRAVPPGAVADLVADYVAAQGRGRIE